jgi:hypothetical protein
MQCAAPMNGGVSAWRSVYQWPLRSRLGGRWSHRGSFRRSGHDRLTPRGVFEFSGISPRETAVEGGCLRDPSRSPPALESGGRHARCVLRCPDSDCLGAREGVRTVGRAVLESRILLVARRARTRGGVDSCSTASIRIAAPKFEAYASHKRRSAVRGEGVSPSSAATCGPSGSACDESRWGRASRSVRAMVAVAGARKPTTADESPAPRMCGEAFPSAGASTANAEFESRGECGEQRCSPKLLWFGSEPRDSIAGHRALGRGRPLESSASRANLRPGESHREFRGASSGRTEALGSHSHACPRPISGATGRRAPLPGFPERFGATALGRSLEGGSAANQRRQRHGKVPATSLSLYRDQPAD